MVLDTSKNLLKSCIFHQDTSCQQTNKSNLERLSTLYLLNKYK